jgi:hypothetical protein
MTELAAITLERHAKKVWKHVTDYAFAAEQTVVPLVGAERAKAALAMPTGFIKLDAGYQLVAITSLQPGTNLYVAPDGKWLGAYLPAALRGYPFQLAQQEGAEEYILCINEASGLVVEDTEDGNAFFDDQDRPTQKIKDTLNFLTQIKASRDATEVAVNALADAGLITPWEINLKQGEKVVPVEGLFRVDEAGLNKIDDKDFLTLRKAGGLALAYAQLLSMSQLAVLERLGELQGQILAKQAANSGSGNVAGFSLSEDEGSLTFD